METTQEKISLLKEMISFALVDGELHDREYDFIEIVAFELGIDKETLHKLFENKEIGRASCRERVSSPV